MGNAYHHLMTRHLAEGRGSRVAYRFEGSEITYAALDQMAAAAAHILSEAGVEPSDRVASFCGDSPDLIAFILGAWRIGAVVVVGNQLCPREQLLSYCREIQPKYLLASELTEPSFNSQVSGKLCLDTIFAAQLIDGPQREEIVAVSSDSISCWQYTQSPEGDELAVLHTHEAIICGAEPFAIDRLNLSENDVCFSIAKLHFGFGFGNSLVFPLSVGACTVLENGRIDMHSVLAKVQQEKVTVCYGVPTFFSGLVAVSNCETRYDLASVRAWVSAGEELAPELYRDFTEKFGQALINGIGSTEMFHIWVSQDLSALTAGHLGTPCKGHEIRLLDADRREVVPGEVGSVWLRGPHNGAGYFERPDKEKDKFEDGWIHSGDRMYQDADGNYCFAGRTDQMVMVGGQKVVLKEVEDELCAHEWVKDVRIQAVRNEYRINSLTAWIRLENIAEPSRRTGRLLRKSLREKLLPHKCPTAFEFLPSYQRSLNHPERQQVYEKRIMKSAVTEPVEWMLELRSLVDERLKELLFDKLQRAERVSTIAPHLVDAIRDLTLRGGKRLRPALLVVGYLSVSKDQNVGRVIDAAVAAELLQTSLLIQDDWMDRDSTRRGGKSVHVEMAERFGDEHLGASVSILAASLAASYAWEALASSDFTGDSIRLALQTFWGIQEDVVVGQLMELAKSDDVDTTHHLKTSIYTVRGPLQLGATLGGCTEEQLQALFRFADPVGLAFQLRDDLLGTYGHPTKTGKPAANDLREGKKTALIDAAYDLASAEQLKELERILGNASASTQDTETARELLEVCGARHAVEKRAIRLMSEAITTLDDASCLREQGVLLLRGIAEILMARLS